MHAVTLRSVVLEKYLNGVVDFGAQHRAQQAQVLPLWRALLEGVEGGICVFAINGFAVGFADAVLALFHIHYRHVIKRLAGHPIDAHRNVVPFDFIHGHVVGSGGSFRLSDEGNCEKRYTKTHDGQSCTTELAH